MDKPLTLEGRWWRPTAPDVQLDGRLEYVPGENIRLRLSGSFDAPMSTNLEQGVIIHGRTFQGFATLLDCDAISRTTAGSGLAAVEYIVSTILKGRLVPNPSEFDFKFVSVEFSNLVDWVAAPPMGFTFTPDGHGAISWDQRPPETLLESAGLKIGINLSYPREGPMTKSVTLMRRAHVELEYGSAQRLVKLWPTLTALQFFFSVAQNFPVLPTELTLYPSRPNHKNPESLLEGIQVYQLYSNLGQGPSSHNDFLFKFPAVKGNIAQLLQTWFDNAEKLNPVLGLFFWGATAGESPIESQFLTVTQAIEAYHRRIHGGLDLSDGAHSDRLTAILASSPDQHRGWLKEKLRFSNELSLRKRLRNLLEVFPFFMQLVHADPNGFISKVVDTRNYLTHYSEGAQGQIVRGRDLLILTDKLRALLLCCLLEGMGMACDKIKAFVTANRKMAILCQRN